MFQKFIHFLHEFPEMLNSFLVKISQPLAFIGFGFTLFVFSLFFLIDVIKKIKNRKSEQ